MVKLGANNEDCQFKLKLGNLKFTNVPHRFQSSCVVQTGLPDFHLMNLTVMRKGFKKYQPKTISYRSHKKFSNEKHRETFN